MYVNLGRYCILLIWRLAWKILVFCTIGGNHVHCSKERLTSDKANTTGMFLCFCQKEVAGIIKFVYQKFACRPLHHILTMAEY